MAESNEVLELMSAHRTVRRFRKTPVPDAHVAAAVRAAQMASTSSWIQAYSLLQVTNPAERRILREYTGDQAQVEEAGAFFCISADTRRHRLIAERAGAPYEGNLETFLLALTDTALFAQNLALAFESQGYGICFVGGLRTRLPEVDALLQLPHGVWPLFGMCVGEPADPQTRSDVRPRLPVDLVWSKDRYPADEAVLAAIDAYDDRAADYYTERGSPGRNWSAGTWRKFRRRLREHLLDYYRSKGATFE